MPEAANPFFAFFLMLMKRQMQFLLIIGVATVFFSLYGYGVSWISFWIILSTTLVLGTFYALMWFWRGIFQSMSNGRN